MAPYLAVVTLAFASYYHIIAKDYQKVPFWMGMAILFWLMAREKKS